VYIHIYACTYSISFHSLVYIHVKKNESHTWKLTYTYIHVCVYVCIYVYIYVYVYIHVYIYIYVYVYSISYHSHMSFVNTYIYMPLVPIHIYEFSSHSQTCHRCLAYVDFFFFFRIVRFLTSDSYFHPRMD